MVEPTKAKLRAFINDEKKSAREYKKYGFNWVANQEEDHYRYFSSFLKGMKREKSLWR